MDAWVIWLVVGIALVLIELATGTLYLLFLGIASFAGAAAAFLGASLLLQAIVGGLIAAFTLAWVQTRNRGRTEAANRPLELGQPVVFENWVDRPGRLARVRFRGTLWDALVIGECRGESGEVLYIRAVDGQRLTIAAGATTG